MPHITIIGGGIAGLATAFYLQEKSQFDYTFIESEPRFGGKIITDRADGFVIEGGPDSFITYKAGGMQLCRDLDLIERLIPTNDDRRNIFVLKNGKLVAFPGGFRLTVPTEFIPFALSPLISPWGKLRMGLDLFIPPRTETGDESLADFIRRRLGEEALDKIGGPIMAGIYVADPEKLSLQSTFPMFAEMEQEHGSLIRAMRAAKKKRPSSTSTNNQKAPAMFTSLQSGMYELVETMVDRLRGELRPGCTVTDLQHRAPGFEVALDSGQTLRTDGVVLAVPAFTAARLVRDFAPALAARLETIRYVSTATVSLGYNRADILPHHDLNGFGFMVPKSEQRNILACTWSSTKFDYRAPADKALLRLFVGGNEREHLVDLPDEEMVAMVRHELADIMGFTAEPVIRRIFRWPKGNVQYDVGHLDRVADMESLADEIPGLYLVGSAFRGIGIPDCTCSALQTVDQILSQVGQTIPVS